VTEQLASGSVPGLRYVPGYLEPDVHDRLLDEIDLQSWHAVGDQRRIQFYGYWYSTTTSCHT
jgi:hypothetical protein